MSVRARRLSRDALGFPFVAPRVPGPVLSTASAHGRTLLLVRASAPPSLVSA